MIKSKVKIEKQLEKKKNFELVETIILAKKNKKWLNIASLLSGPTRNQYSVNLDKIENQTTPGDIIVIPGKVLSLGNVSKKVRVVALGFSEKAREKLLKSNCEIRLLKDEIKDNKEAKGVKIIQ